MSRVVASKAVSSTTKMWLSHPETYPIIGIVGGGLAWMTYRGVYSATANPDVHWDRDVRTNGGRSEAEAEKWGRNAREHSRWNRPGVDVGYASIFEPVKHMFGTKKVDGLAKKVGPDASSVQA